MANVLIAYQGDSRDRLHETAAAVARGARTVRAADVESYPFDTLDIDALRWCDGLVVGVHPDPRRAADGLNAWLQGLEPHVWDAVQGKFALVFESLPWESERPTRARDRTARLLTGHGMLLTGFADEAGRVVDGAGLRPGSDHRACERLGRLFAGMTHAWVDRSGDPGRKRILASLVRATRRVAAVRPPLPGTVDVA